MYQGRATEEEWVKLAVYSPPDLSRPTFEKATSNKFRDTKVGELFGPSWATHWFKVQIKVPSILQSKEHLEFHWDANNEGLVWTEDGEPLQGLTGGGERIEWILPKHFRDGEYHTIYIEMACNQMFGNPPGDIIQPPDPNHYFRLGTADIVAVNLEARALNIDFWQISGRYHCLIRGSVLLTRLRCRERTPVEFLGITPGYGDLQFDHGYIHCKEEEPAVRYRMSRDCP